MVRCGSSSVPGSVLFASWRPHSRSSVAFGLLSILIRRSESGAAGQRERFIECRYQCPRSLCPAGRCSFPDAQRQGRLTPKLSSRPHNAGCGTRRHDGCRGLGAGLAGASPSKTRDQPGSNRRAAALRAPRYAAVCFNALLGGPAHSPEALRPLCSWRLHLEADNAASPDNG